MSVTRGMGDMGRPPSGQKGVESGQTASEDPSKVGARRDAGADPGPLNGPPPDFRIGSGERTRGVGPRACRWWTRGSFGTDELGAVMSVHNGEQGTTTPPRRNR